MEPIEQHKLEQESLSQFKEFCANTGRNYNVRSIPQHLAFCNYLVLKFKQKKNEARHEARHDAINAKISKNLTKNKTRKR